MDGVFLNCGRTFLAMVAVALLIGLIYGADTNASTPLNNISETQGARSEVNSQ